MSLAERILEAIDINGISPKHLQQALDVPSAQLDYALTGLLRSGKVRLASGLVIRPDLIPRPADAPFVKKSTKTALSEAQKRYRSTEKFRIKRRAQEAKRRAAQRQS